MPEYPLLPLPAPERGVPPKPSRFAPRDPKLSPGRQGQRLGPKFGRLWDVLASDSNGLSLRADPSSIAPERALVLEVVGSVSDFHALARKVEGLEFLADEEIEFQPDEDFFETDNRAGRKGRPRMDKAVGGRLYLAMPDIHALRQLLSLWRRWQRGEDLRRGQAGWQGLFERLRDIRPWGAVDRITDETIGFWHEEIDADRSAMLRIEAELWFRESAGRRERAHRRVAEAASEAGGDIVHHAVIEDIGYQAVLIDLPSAEVARLAAREEIHLATCDDVTYLRPQSSAGVPEPGGDIESEHGASIEPPADLPPVAALLDGVPVQNHRLLAERLDVDDPDDLASMSLVEGRYHGTAMASLILHGDRYLHGPPISRKLHVRPVLRAPEHGLSEEPRRDRLLVDTIHRAVRRMKEGDNEGEATAPEVFLVNLSLGDSRRPFSGAVSPWAKLLDYLADRYGILFLVSAGNIDAPLTVPAFSDWTSFEGAGVEERERAVLQALSDRKAYRTLLSPAEALNIVTVGAWHHDAFNGPRGAGSVDPYGDGELPNVSSALGLGHRKIVKPDIHLPGGREHVRFRASGKTLTVVPGGRCGLSAAAPDPAGNLDRVRPSNGTSTATALATRAAHRLFEALMDVEGGSMHSDMEPRFYAVVIKALLVHRSKWGNRADFLSRLYGPHGQGKHIERHDNIARLLGYGFPDIEEAISCAPNRATLVGHGTIAAKTANIHRIPLPPSLDGVTEPRAITVTVAWLSPINHRHRAYRRAKLEVGAVKRLEDAAGVKRSKEQPSDKSGARGTVSHTRYKGREAVPFVDDGHVLLRVFCREQAGQLDQNIRYGIAVTIEAGENIPVYQEVKAKLSVPVGAQL